MYRESTDDKTFIFGEWLKFSCRLKTNNVG